MNSNSEKKVLLLIIQDVELEKSFRNVYENSGFDIMSVSSGKKALEVISEIKPSIILSEFSTEDWDNRMLITTFMNSRSHMAYRNIPFIVLSDEEQKERYSSEYIQMGIRGWYTKPFGAHEMKDVIDNILITHGLIEKTLELKQEVKRSKYRYRDLLENANDFIFTLDIDGSFVYLNNRFAPLTGYDKDSWIGRPFGDLIYQPDREDALDYYKMTHQGRARIFEARVICRTDSNPPYLSFNITPIFEKGAIVGSIGIARDVTESKKMEKEILDLKNFNESIIQSMEAGLLTTNLKGIITSLNSGGEKILEWKNSEIIGRSLTEILKPSEAKYLLSSPPPPGALPYSREMQLTVKSGRKISVGFTTTNRIDNQGNKVGSIVSFRDITQLKQMQSEVMRMDRLASLGVLASGIAHEIKNPLAGIKTMAQACEEEFDTEDPRREYLIRIVRQVNRLDDLLKTFFAYARPKPPDRDYHTVHDILNDVLNLVRKKLSSCGIEYIEEISSELPKIWVDSQQIQQVFLNLMLNSIDAMKEGGILKIQSREIKKPKSGVIHHNASSKTFNNGIFVEIYVSDTGVGIEKENLETIFDPFFTTKPNGLGLGLSIVYRIIEEHKGDIRVESHIGHGTTFAITLPTGA